MQAPDIEWAHGVAALLGAGVGAFGSIIAGVWKFKEVIEKVERRMQVKLDTSEASKINEFKTSEQRVEAKVDAVHRTMLDKVDHFERRFDDSEQRNAHTLTMFEQQFRDTFTALRQKINDVELGTEKHFVSKQGFESFLAEYREDRKERREDMKTVMQKLNRMDRAEDE